MKSMTIENRRSISKLKHERTALRRQPGSMPNLRAGRGGGGWTLSEDPLLSDGTEKIAPFMVNGVARLKRDVQMGPNALDPSVVNEDLARFRIRIKTPVEKPGKTSVTAASPSAATPVPPAVEGSEPPARIEHNAAPPGGPWSTSNAKGYTRPSYEHFPLYEYVQPAPGPSKRGPSHFYDHEPIKHHAHDPQRYDHPGPSSQQRHYMPPLPSYDTLSSRFDRGNDMESEARQTPTLERPPAHLRDYRDHDSFARPPIGMGLPLPLPPPRPQHPSLRAGMGDLVIPPWNPSTGKTGRPMTQADMPPPRLPR